MTPDVLCSNLVKLIPDATLLHFGVLQSTMHMAWMHQVCGRLKSDYRYSNHLVYNNFPWPPVNGGAAGSGQVGLRPGEGVAEEPGASVTARNREAIPPTGAGAPSLAPGEDSGARGRHPPSPLIQKVETCAQAVLDARAKFPDSSLADLYDPLTMPGELVKAHRELDAAVDRCYCKEAFRSELERVEFLFVLYETYTEV